MKYVTQYWDWLTLADYKRKMAEATVQNVARFSRGNVLLKLGHYLNRQRQKELLDKGDKAMTRLSRAISHH